MEYVICYDLTDDRRRTRVVETLLDFGQRIEESVFVAFLDDTLRDKMLTRLREEIEPAEDTVHVFPVCETCAAKTVALGLGRLPEEKPFYVV